MQQAIQREHPVFTVYDGIARKLEVKVRAQKEMAESWINEPWMTTVNSTPFGLTVSDN